MGFATTAALPHRPVVELDAVPLPPLAPTGHIFFGTPRALQGSLLPRTQEFGLRMCELFYKTWRPTWSRH